MARCGVATFQAALQAVEPAEAFPPAVSPGTLAQNVINEYYKDEEAFLFAVAEVMHEEYHAIVNAGFLLQIDSPDLAMGWHTQFPEKTLAEFRQIIALRVEVLNHALAGIPPEVVRHHICWGNGERPHHRDAELKDIIDILLMTSSLASFIPSGGDRTDFVAVVDQVIALLRQRGRVAYRTLKRQFQLDDEAIEDLKIELLDSLPT